MPTPQNAWDTLYMNMKRPADAEPQFRASSKQIKK